jgi:hypothetical protein
MHNISIKSVVMAIIFLKRFCIYSEKQFCVSSSDLMAFLHLSQYFNKYRVFNFGKDKLRERVEMKICHIVKNLYFINSFNSMICKSLRYDDLLNNNMVLSKSFSEDYPILFLNIKKKFYRPIINIIKKLVCIICDRNLVYVIEVMINSFLFTNN